MQIDCASGGPVRSDAVVYIQKPFDRFKSKDARPQFLNLMPRSNEIPVTSLGSACYSWHFFLALSRHSLELQVGGLPYHSQPCKFNSYNHLPQVTRSPEPTRLESSTQFCPQNVFCPPS